MSGYSRLLTIARVAVGVAAVVLVAFLLFMALQGILWGMYYLIPLFQPQVPWA